MSRPAKIIASVAVLVVLAGAAWFLVNLIRDAVTPVAGPGPECVVQPNDTGAAVLTVALGDSTLVTSVAGAAPVLDDALSLTAVQLQHAATVNAVGLHRGLSARARVIAVATALQESSLRNLASGDLDSVGLFQQRPSQGWGTFAQISDPIYAAGKFYDALVDVSGWETLALTDAAQAVQRSGHPTAYAKWEPAATQLVTALSGPGYRAVTCRSGATAPTADAPARPALDGTASANAQLGAALADANAELGGITLDELPGPDRGVVTAALANLSAAESAGALASWAVAHATGSGITAVEIDGFSWQNNQWTTGATQLPAGQVRITAGPAAAA